MKIQWKERNLNLNLTEFLEKGLWCEQEISKTMIKGYQRKNIYICIHTHIYCMHIINTHLLHTSLLLYY